MTKSPDYLSLLASHFGVNEDQVLGFAIDEDAQEVSVLIDKGIAGVPKYTIPVADLEDVPPEEADEAIPASDDPAVDLNELSVKDLRSMADELGIEIPAKAKKAEIVILIEEAG